MSSARLSDAYCTIEEAACTLECTKEEIIRQLEQGEIGALINAEFDSILGVKKCGYIAISPEIVLYINSNRYDTLTFKTPTGATAEARALLANIRVQRSSLQQFHTAPITEVSNLKSKLNAPSVTNKGSEQKEEWTIEKKFQLLEEHSALVRSRDKSPTKNLSEKYKVSKTIIKRHIKTAREYQKVSNNNPVVATPWEVLLPKS